MKKTKQFLVLGLGSFGNSVAKTICELGHEALAVDGDLEKVERATEFVTQAVQANITDEATLRSMGIRNYDACIVAIGKDLKASILVCMMLKDMEAKYIIAKANDNIHAKILRQLGVDRVVFPERDTGIRVANSIVTNNVLDLMELNDDFRIAEIHVPEEWCGKSIVEVDVRKKYKINVLAINREDNFIVSPLPSTVFKPNDNILVLGKTEDIDDLDDIN